MTELTSVSYRDFTKNGWIVFMSSLVMVLPIIILVTTPTSPYVNKAMVFFGFIPAIAVVTNFIVNTLKWLIEYIICKFNGISYKAFVVGYDKHKIIVDIDDSRYSFDVEYAQRKYAPYTVVTVRVYKKFAYILDEVKHHARVTRSTKYM